jgi:biotin operon repressor
MKMEKNDETLLKALTVDTYRIYNYFLERNPNEVTLEELAKTFKVTKPAILHHIEKLKRVDLIEQTVNGYRVKDVVKIAVIKGYTKQVYGMLKTWVPISMLFTFLLSISIFLIEPIEMKGLSVLLCIVGVLYSIYNILNLKRL